jgi:restriction system protein
MSRKGVSKSWKLAEQLIFTAFQILKEHDGQLQGNQVITQVGQRVALDDWAKARYEKSGYIRRVSASQMLLTVGL